MKASLLILALILAGCAYDVPLSEPQDLPLNLALIGIWETLPDSTAVTDDTQQMIVLPCGDGEFFVHVRSGPEGLYVRAYPIAVDGERYHQVQLIGTVDSTSLSVAGGYHLVWCRLVDGILEVRTLNTDLVDTGIASSAELLTAFREQRSDPDLFIDPARFRRVAPAPAREDTPPVR